MNTFTESFSDFADLALLDWAPMTFQSARRHREVARYHNAAWRELLNAYLSAREQLKQAKQILSATPSNGPKWSAWSRYINGLKSTRAAVVRRLTKRVTSARAALGQPITVWKRRPLVAPKPKFIKLLAA